MTKDLPWCIDIVYIGRADDSLLSWFCFSNANFPALSSATNNNSSGGGGGGGVVMGNKQTKHAKSKRDEVRPCSFTYTLTYTTHAHASARIHKRSNMFTSTHTHTLTSTHKWAHQTDQGHSQDFKNACPIQLFKNICLS